MAKPKTKYCRKCNKDKPVKEFNKDKKQKDGLNYYCRSCVKVINQRKRLAERERYAAKTLRIEKTGSTQVNIHTFKHIDSLFEQLITTHEEIKAAEKVCKEEIESLQVRTARLIESKQNRQEVLCDILIDAAKKKLAGHGFATRRLKYGTVTISGDDIKIVPHFELYKIIQAEKLRDGED